MLGGLRFRISRFRAVISSFSGFWAAGVGGVQGFLEGGVHGCRVRRV